MYKKQDEVIVIDNEDDDVVPGEFIKDESVDRFSVSGDTTFPGQEMVNLNENSQSHDEGGILGCGKRKIKPRPLLYPKMKGKTNGDRVTAGVAFLQIKR